MDSIARVLDHDASWPQLARLAGASENFGASGRRRGVPHVLRVVGGTDRAA
jgi:hypothetical protein